MPAPVFAGVWSGFQNMKKTDGESGRSDGQPCPALQKLQEFGHGNADNARVYQVTLEKLAEVEQTLSAHTGKKPTGSGWKSVGAKMAGLVIIAACVAGELSPEPNAGQSIHAHGGHENKRLVVRRPVVRKRSDGADPKPSPNLGLADDTAGKNQLSVNAGAGCNKRVDLCEHRTDDGVCRTTAQPCRLSEFTNYDLRLPIEEIGGRTADILRAILFQRDLLTGLIQGQEKLLAMGLPARAEPVPVANKELRTIGRFQYGAGFRDVWLGGEHYDLRGRSKARFCLQYLVAKQAFDADSARHLENEIDPFVRKKCQLPPLPESAQSNIRIQHFFNDPSRKLTRLRRDLVKAAGRNGRFYLQVV